MEEKKMVSSLAWISRGFAKNVPKEYEANEEEKAEYAKAVASEKKYFVQPQSVGRRTARR